MCKIKKVFVLLFRVYLVLGVILNQLYNFFTIGQFPFLNS